MLHVSPSFVERVGLLTIIVLGEVVVGTVNGLAGLGQLSSAAGLTAGLGMLIAIGIWWIYFDFISMRPPQPHLAKVGQWFYAHLPLTGGIAAAGAAVFNVVERSGATLEPAGRWLLAGAVALVLLCTALLMRAIQVPDAYLPAYRRGGILTAVSASLILLLGLVDLQPIPFLIILIVLLLLPILYGVKIWIVQIDAEEMSLD